MMSTKALGIVQKYFPEVTRIIDAKSDLVVKVNSGDARGANPLEPNHCVLANAMCRKKQADGAVVSLKVAYVKRGSVAFRYVCSAPVTREVTAYGKSNRFTPGVYTFTPPPPSQRLGATRHEPPETTGPKRRVIRRRFKTSGIREL